MNNGEQSSNSNSTNNSNSNISRWLTVDNCPTIYLSIHLAVRASVCVRRCVHSCDFDEFDSCGRLRWQLLCIGMATVRLKLTVTGAAMVTVTGAATATRGQHETLWQLDNSANHNRRLPCAMFCLPQQWLYVWECARVCVTVVCFCV